jgi:hypothetical protein
MKTRSLLLFGIIVVMMSSCVYSLFPIYTEDTIVFKEELLGKWKLDEAGSYMLFEPMSKGSNEQNSEEDEYKYSIKIKEGFTLSSDDPIFIMVNGKKIYDEDSIIMIMNERMANTEVAPKIESPTPEEMTEAIKENIKEDKLTPQDISYNGSISVHEKKSYKLTIYSAEAVSCDEKGKKEAYIAHLVEIGDDLFMDLYPVKEFSSLNVSDNYFPVHTFYKVKVTEDEFLMTHFDLDKLNKLFESNRIRLRHENVEGTILITAQPKELQKFIDQYSDDETVFDYTDTYQRAL